MITKIKGIEADKDLKEFILKRTKYSNSNLASLNISFKLNQNHGVILELYYDEPSNAGKYKAYKAFLRELKKKIKGFTLFI